MTRKTLASILLGSLVAAALVSAPGTAAAGKKKAPKKVVIGEDPVGDWGANSAAGSDAAPLGDVLGQDLISAAIEMKDKETVNFIISLNALPPSGGVPEISRYSWNFSVDGEPRELDGKFTNFSRGICDPTAGTCPPPRDPGLYPFSLRGNCGVTPIGTVNFTTCEELALVPGTFDAAAGTITVAVPMKALGAKPGTKIAPEVGIFGGAISAAPSAWATFDSFPMDVLNATKTFVVPK